MPSVPNSFGGEVFGIRRLYPVRVCLKKAKEIRTGSDVCHDVFKIGEKKRSAGRNQAITVEKPSGSPAGPIEWSLGPNPDSGQPRELPRSCARGDREIEPRP